MNADSGGDLFKFRPKWALAGAGLGLLAGVLLGAKTGHWAWLLLAPTGGLLMAWSFWGEYLPDIDFPDHS